MNVRLDSSPYFPGEGHGGAPLKRVYADYVFDSSSNNLNDLADCEVWESKTFSGDTPPNSTFPGQTSGASGQMTGNCQNCHPTTDGFFTDAHETLGALGNFDASVHHDSEVSVQMPRRVGSGFHDGRKQGAARRRSRSNRQWFDLQRE